MKITLIGAGSASFTHHLVSDILLKPDLDNGTIALVDIDPQQLERAQQLTEMFIQQTGSKWKVEGSTDRTRVLPGSDYIFSTIEVGGLVNISKEYEIPMKYGVDQCIGDTIGPGGLFKALRTVPSWLAILEDIKRLCPRAKVFNYSNPLSLTVLSGIRASGLPIVGLCHSIPNGTEQIAKLLNVPEQEISFRAAGINHLNWFVEISHRGEDLYPRLFEMAKRPEIFVTDPVRFEMMFQLGAFMTEGSGHDSEYVPYFRKRPDLVKNICGLRRLGGSGEYAKNWELDREETHREIEEMLSGKKNIPLLQESTEYAIKIVHAMETGTPTMIFGNVPNHGLVENLPDEGIVEIACLVDQSGIQPTYFGVLPTHMAALLQPHFAFHDLVATALVEKNREAAVHALMLDPLTAAVCSLSEIRELFDELALAEKDYLPDFLQK